jgi:hypothetical protein
VALPPVPSNLGTLGGALGYVGGVTRAVLPEQERGWMADLGVGLMQGIPQAAQQVGGVLRMAGQAVDAPGEMTKGGGLAPQLQDAGRYLTQTGQGVAQALPQTQGFAGDVGMAIPGAMGMVGAGVLTGGLGAAPMVATGVGALTGGAQQAGGVYNEALGRMGDTPAGQQIAATEGAIAGGVSAVMGAVPLGRVLGPVLQRMTGKVAPAIINRAAGRVGQSVAGRLLLDAAGEGSQEAADELTEMFLQRVVELDPNAFDGWQGRVARAAGVGATLGAGMGVGAEVAGRGQNANRQNNQGGQDSSVSRAGGPVPAGGPVVPGGGGVARPGDAAQPATGQAAGGVVEQGDSSDPELTDEEAQRIFDGEDAAPAVDAAGIPIPRGAGGFQGVTNEGTFVPPELQGRATSEPSTPADPGLDRNSQRQGDAALAALLDTTRESTLPSRSQEAFAGPQSDASQGSASVSPLGGQAQGFLPASRPADGDGNFDTTPSQEQARVESDFPENTPSSAFRSADKTEAVGLPRPDRLESRTRERNQGVAGQASPDSTPDLALMSQKIKGTVTLADPAKVTEAERKAESRLSSLGRRVVWVDAKSDTVDLRGAVAGRTPTTIYLRRGQGNVKLAAVALHEVMHSARRTNRELADQLVEVFGRDRVLARGRQELGLQSDAGVDVAQGDDAAIDEGLAGLLEDAAAANPEDAKSDNADLRARILETPGLLDRLRVWLKQTLNSLAGKGSQEVVHAMKLLDRLEAQARKEAGTRDTDSVAWAQTATGIAKKVEDAYSSGSMQAMQERGDNLLASSPSMSREVFDSNLEGYAHEGDVLNFSGPIPTEIKSLVGKRGILKYGFRANVKGGKAEDSFASMGEDRFMEAVKAQYENRTGKGKVAALRKAMEPEARFIAAFAELTQGKKPMPSVPQRVAGLGVGDVVRIQDQAARIDETDDGELVLRGGHFNGLTLTGMDTIPVDARDGVWKYDEAGTAPRVNEPAGVGSDLPFSARKLELQSQTEQGTLGFSRGGVAPQAPAKSQRPEPRLTPEQRAELYPGIRQGESVRAYEKRMGTADTPMMFEDVPDRQLKQRPGEFDDAYSRRMAAENAKNVIEEPQKASAKDLNRAIGFLGRMRHGYVSRGISGKMDMEGVRYNVEMIDRDTEILKFWYKQKEKEEAKKPGMLFSARSASIDLSDQRQSVDLLRNRLGITERVYELARKLSAAERELKRLDGRNTLTDPSIRQPAVRSEEARERLREQSIKQMVNQVRLKNDDDIRPGVGGALPPGGLRTERLAFLVMGSPAAGKSGISERLADQHGAALVDNDYLKRTLPEFMGAGGFSKAMGAQLTHEEASNLYRRTENHFAAQGANMVIPIVGASQQSVQGRIDRLKAAGYQVKLLSVSLAPEKTAARALYRFDQTGRYVPLNYILNDIAQKPDEVYNATKGSSDGYQQVSSDTPRGQAPKLIEESDSFATLGGTTESNRRGRGVSGRQYAFPGRDEEAQPGLGSGDRSGPPEVNRTGPQEPGSEDLSPPETRFSARRQPNLNEQDRADARTVGKLSQQAVEASQNLDAEKGRRKAEVGGVKAQRDIERRAGEETQRELDRTVKLRDRRERALTNLIEQQQAANAQLNIELGDANDENTARRMAMKSMFGTIQDAQRQLRKAAATIQKATDKAKARADAEETAAKVRDAVVEIAKQLPPSIRGRMLTDVRDATDMRDLLGSEVTGTTKAGKRAAQTMGALGKAADLLIRYNGKEAWNTIEDITSRKSMASLTEERRKAITKRVAGADSLYRQTQASLAPASRADAAEELMAIADDVRAIVHEHKLENRIIKAGRLADAEIARDDVRKAIAAAKTVLPPNPRKPQAKVQPSRVRQWLHEGNYNLDTIAKVLDGNMQGGGPVHKIVVEDIRAGMDRKFEVLEAATRVADAIAQDAGFDNLAHLLELASGSIGDGTTKTVNLRLAGKDHTLTWGQLAKVVSSLDDVSTLADIQEGTPITFDDAPNAKGIRLRAEDIQTIRDAMPEQLREAVAGMKKIRDRLFPVAQSAQRVVTGREAPAQPGYEPRIRNMAQSQRVTDMDPMAVGFENKLIENSGFLQTRVRDLKTPLLMGDFFADWQRSIHGMADVMHLMIPLRNAREVIMHESVNNAIADRWGDRAVESIKDRLRTVVRPPERSNFARVANQLARNVAVSRTALAPASLAISATASIPRLWAELGTARLLKGIKSIASTKVREDMLKASPWLRSRVTGAVSNIASTMPMLEGVVDSDWDKAAGERWRATRERVKRGGKAAIRQVILAASEARKGQGREALNQAGQVFTRSIPAITDEVRLQSWIDSKMAQIAWAAYDGDKAQAEKALRLVLPSADPLAQTGWSHELNASGFGSVLGSFRSDANAAYNHISQAWMTDPKRGLRVTSALLAGALIAAVIKGLDRELKDELEGRENGRGVDAALLRFGQETLGAGFLSDKVFSAIDGIGGVSDTPVSGSVDQVAKSTSNIASTIYTAITSDDEAKVEKKLGTLLDDLLRLMEGAGTLTRNPIVGITPYARALAK